MLRTWTKAVALAVGLLAATAAPAAALNYAVNTNADDGGDCDQPTPVHCTLRQAISLAGDNHPATVSVPAGRYILDPTRHALQLFGGVTVIGAGARVTTIDGNKNPDHVFAYAPSNPGDAATLSHLTVTGGRPAAEAGGDIRSLGSLTLDHVWVTDGSSSGGGGGVANVGGTLTVDHSLLDNNLASGAEGGAILSSGTSGAPATLHVVNSTITENGANGDGGGISVTGDSSNVTTLSHVTVATNGSPSTGGGGLNVDPASGTIEIGGSIFSGNTRNSMPTNCTGVTAIDDGANVESGSECGLNASSDRQGADAALGALGDNGGETDVRPLGSTSAAIDLVPAAGCPATDQADRSRPKGTACDAGAYEADAPANPPPPPPPPPGPHAHTLLGQITYEPAYPVGALESTIQSPFVISPVPRLEVVLLSPSRSQVAHQPVDPRAADPLNGFGTYRFDDLPACDACTLQLRDDKGVVQDARTVSFDGAEGQTSQPLVFSGQPGGVGTGWIQQGHDRVEPRTLSVRVTSRTGRVLADTRAIRPQCYLGGQPGAYCPGQQFGGYQYRLTGLPTDGQTVTVALYQQPLDGDQFVVVDTRTVPLTLGDDRTMHFPTLAALDAVPGGHGRVVYGTISNLPPFAPGDRLPDQGIPAKHHPTVVLRDGARHIATTPVVSLAGEPPSYRLSGLPACSRCTLELRDGPRLVDRAHVTLPGMPTPSVTRRDLQLRDVAGHFLTGQVESPSSVRPDHLRVEVSIPGERGTIADSQQLPHACRPGTGPGHCEAGGNVSYRLAGIPARKQVLVTLLVNTGGRGWLPVDSRLVLTAPPDADTIAPNLRLLPGVGGHDPGLQLIGRIAAGGAFAPGAEPAAISARSRFDVALVDGAGNVAGHSPAVVGAHPVPSFSYQMINLAPCSPCTLVLRDSHAVVQSRVPMSLFPESPSVALSPPVPTHHGVEGPYLQGQLSSTQPHTVGDVVVRVLDSPGHVLVSTSDRDVWRKCGIPAGACPRWRGDTHFSLGHMPAGGQVTVVVGDTQSHKVLASAKVTLAGNGADTNMGSLQLKNR